MRIENNYEYNSIELYFDGKPDEMTRETLKMFKWKWNPKKFCWYNKNTTENMALAESLNSSAEEMRAKKYLIPMQKSIIKRNLRIQHI